MKLIQNTKHKYIYPTMEFSSLMQDLFDILFIYGYY